MATVADFFIRVAVGHNQRSARPVEGALDGFGQACTLASADFQTIDDQFGRVATPAPDLNVFIQAQHVTIQTYAGKTLLAQSSHKIAIVLVVPGLHRREQQHVVGIVLLEYARDDLRAGLGAGRHVAFGAVGDAQTGVERPKVIIYLGDGTDGGPGTSAGPFLFDANRRRESGHLIHSGFLDLSEKLSRIGRERLDIPALSFRIDRIQGQG